MKLNISNPIFEGLPKAYLVGGSVRDMICGKKPLDFDIAVPENPEAFASELALRLNKRIIKLGKDKFSVYRIVSDSLSVDVTATKAADIDSDLMKRDFTINAMACDLSTGEVIDRFKGVEDLIGHRVRMVSPDVFRDDPVRLIRAFRMAATLGFQIEAKTYRTIAGQSGTIGRAATERIWAELKRILACRHTIATIEEMADTAVLEAVIPEMTALQGCGQNKYHIADVFTHTMEAYRAMENLLNDPGEGFTEPVAEFIQQTSPETRVLIKLAVLLHDVGKPSSRSIDNQGNTHFYGHSGKGAAMARMICKRLRLSNHDQKWVELVVRHHQRPLSLFLAQQQHAARPKAIGRFFRQCGADAHYILLHAVADNMGKAATANHDHIKIIDFIKDLLADHINEMAKKNRRPLINGNDLIKHFDLVPSPLIGKILNCVEALQIGGRLNDRDQALQWVSDYLQRKSGRN